MFPSVFVPLTGRSTLPEPQMQPWPSLHPLTEALQSRPLGITTLIHCTLGHRILCSHRAGTFHRSDLPSSLQASQDCCQPVFHNRERSCGEGDPASSPSGQPHSHWTLGRTASFWTGCRPACSILFTTFHHRAYNPDLIKAVVQCLSCCGSRC